LPLRLDTPEMPAVGTGYLVVVASSWLTICWAFARPAGAPPDAAAEELAATGELAVALLELELQAASTAAAVIAAPGASQRFHLCVIAFGPPSHQSRQVRERLFSTPLLMSRGER
jgi:hypothetical protein